MPASDDAYSHIYIDQECTVTHSSTCSGLYACRKWAADGCCQQGVVVPACKGWPSQAAIAAMAMQACLWHLFD